MHRFQAMGCDVALAGGSRARAAGVLERWERAFSLFRPESELSRVNASPARMLCVSRLFASTLRTALDVAAETVGLVDPTFCGRWPEVVVSGRLVLRPPGLALDLNGVAKALAVDEAAVALDGQGFVSVGGDLAVRDRWTSRCRQAARSEISGGLATSGTASRGAHLVDRTGHPSKSRWEQVTASGTTCLAADVARSRLPPGDGGPEWLDARGIPGRFVAVDGEIVENDTWARATQLVQTCT